MSKFTEWHERHNKLAEKAKKKVKPQKLAMTQRDRDNWANWNDRAMESERRLYASARKRAGVS